MSWIYTNEFSKLFFLPSFLCVEEIVPPPCLSIISNGNELNSLENKSWNTQAEIATVSSGRTDNNKALIEWGLWDDCSLSLSLSCVVVGLAKVVLTNATNARLQPAVLIFNNILPQNKELE